MIVRTTDSALINRIANSDGVRELVDYRDDKSVPMDFTPACDRPGLTGMVWLTDGADALACFVLTGVREFQAHLFFGTQCRGTQALKAGREMIAHLRPWADRLWGLIPTANVRARWFARRMGFTNCGWGEETGGVPAEYLEWSAA